MIGWILTACAAGYVHDKNVKKKEVNLREETKEKVNRDANYYAKNLDKEIETYKKLMKFSGKVKGAK